MDMQYYGKHNRYLYALLGYDTYSKYLSFQPMLNRQMATVLAGLQDIVNGLPFSLSTIYWDKVSLLFINILCVS